MFSKLKSLLGLGSNKGSCCDVGCKVCPDFKVDVFSPCDGLLVKQKNIPDEGFSEGYMGSGVGIEPTSPEVVSPMTGRIVVLFKTKHAYIIKDGDTGVSVMLHLGINTVNIPEDRNAFATERKVEEDINAGENLCTMDLDVIKKEATSTISALLVQNEGMEGKKVIFHKASGEVKRGDLLMSVVPADRVV